MSPQDYLKLVSDKLKAQQQPGTLHPWDWADSPELAKMMSFVTDQFFYKKGLQLFGSKGRNTLRVGLKQLHDHKVGQPKHASTLS